MVAQNGARSTSLVVSAIRKLRDVRGASSRDIINFISSEYDISGPNVKRQVQMALRRGVSHGLINRDKGGYYLANPSGLTISCDTLVDRGHRRGCKKRRRRRRRSSRGRKCRRRRSRRARRRRGRKCRSKRSRRRRRGKKRCGRRGRRRAGDDEMDSLAVTTLGRGEPRKTKMLARSRFQERTGTRSKSPSDRSLTTRSSSGSTPIDNPNEL